MARAAQPIDVARLRLVAQRIHSPGRGLVDAVRALTAMQGQDLPGVLWSIGLRVAGATEADVRAAFDRGELVRSWPMRGTLHVTTPDDLRMILPLSRDRLQTSFAARHRELGITSSDLAIAERAAIASLDDRPLSRKELFTAFETAGQPTTGQRGAHLISALAHSGLVCLGPFVGREQAFVLLDQWAPSSRSARDREEDLAEITLRYFRYHGPATVADLAWWANLTLTDVRRATAAVADRLETLTVGENVYYGAPGVLELAGAPPGPRRAYALPGFDEYLLGYTDRSAALTPQHSPLIVPGNNGMFRATIVLGGRVAGTWLRSEKSGSIQVRVTPFTAFSSSQNASLGRALDAYGKFKAKTIELSIAATKEPSAL